MGSFRVSRCHPLDRSQVALLSAGPAIRAKRDTRPLAAAGKGDLGVADARDGSALAACLCSELLTHKEHLPVQFGSARQAISPGASVADDTLWHQSARLIEVASDHE